MTEIPYTRDNLGEENYAPERGGPVDRQIDNQEAHVAFYSDDPGTKQVEPPAPDGIPEPLGY